MTLALVLGCDAAHATRERSKRAFETNVAPLVHLEDASTNSLLQEEATAEQASRRSYSSESMKLHACAQRKDDGTIVGQNCASSLVVFGPYVTVPAESVVRLAFQIESPSRIAVMSDILSDGAKRFHGAFDERVLEPAEPATIRYRIKLFDAVKGLETRIGIRADSPVAFTISKFELTVE